MTLSTSVSPRPSQPPAEPAAGPRVLVVLKRPFGAAGMQFQARRVAKLLREQGLPVTFVSHSRHPLRELPEWTQRLPTRVLVAPDQWAFGSRLYRHLCRCRDQYDLVHVHGFGIEAFAAIAARRVTQKPLVVKSPTGGPGTGLRRAAQWTRALPFLAPAVWRRVDAWVSLSSQVRDDLLRMGVEPRRIVPVPNGVNTSQFRPLPDEERSRLRQELGLGPGDRVVCTTARLCPSKRIDLLIRSFATAAHDAPASHLWIMGDGELGAALRALAAGSGMGDRIRFWGPSRPADVTRNLQAADVFALLSDREGLSNALLEAMACRVAPVVTDTSGMRDVLQDGVSGLIVPPRDEAAARTALAALLTDDGLRQSLATAAEATVRDRYTLAETARRLRALYEECLTGSLAVNG